MPYKKGNYRREDIVRGLSADDIAFARERYQETGDPIYLVLALGNSAGQPEPWALAEATNIADEVERTYHPSLDPIETGRLLDGMVRAYLDLYDAQGREHGSHLDPLTQVRPGRGKRSYELASLDELIRRSLSENLPKADRDPASSDWKRLKESLHKAWYAEAEQAGFKDHSSLPLTNRVTRVILQTSGVYPVTPRRADLQRYVRSVYDARANARRPST